MKYASNDEVFEWIKAAQRNDEHAKERLIYNFQPLVSSLVQRYSKHLKNNEEIMQVGMLGLIKAVQRFDLQMRNNFMSYAIPTIAGEIKRHFRDCTWDIHVPRYVKENYMHVNKANYALHQLLERKPTHKEIADYLQVEEWRVKEVMELQSYYSALSLESTTVNTSVDDGELTLIDFIGKCDEELEKIEKIITLNVVFSYLTKEERNVLRGLYYENKTQTNLAREMKVSQMHISRVQRRAIRKLKNAIYDEVEKSELS